MSSKTPLRVVIAGGGVAGLEASLALRELAAGRVEITMLAPEPEFVYRPMSVCEPFAFTGARHYDLAAIAADIGVELRADAFSWLDPAGRIVHTGGGDVIGYDALLLALGARQYVRFKHAITLDDHRIDDQLHGLIQDIEGNYLHRLAFLVPPRMPWPLPVYELALMSATRALEMGTELSVFIVSPEQTPLDVFGCEASEAVSALLSDRGVEFVSTPHCEVTGKGVVSLWPAKRELHVDQIVALPELFGPSTPGVSGGERGGFIPVDAQCRVKRMEATFAAGDATAFPVKLGGIAAQQADVAAASIAALAGAEVKPELFNPEIEAILLGGDRPLRLTARLIGGRATDSHAEATTLDPARSKLAARFLGPYLAEATRHEIRSTV